jgi:sugar porter (SP) family MFS transporter
MVYLISSIAALSGLLFGFDEGVIAGILPTLTHYFGLTEASLGFLASALPLGAMFASIVLGSYIATKLTTKIGRRTAILTAAILFTISAIGAALSFNLATLVLARLITGIAIGIAGVMTPLYIAEMAPANLRGRLVSCYQLAITIGIMLGYLVNYLFVYGINWRWMFAAGAIPALILLIGMFFLPESHRWLVLSNQADKAKAVLNRINRNSNINSEVRHIEHTIQEEGPAAKWRDLFSPTIRPALIVAMVLFILQQISGINVVIYYAPSIFASVGLGSESTQILATVGVGLVNMLTTVLAMWLVEKIGRRKLLYIGFAGTAITLVVISMSTQLQAAHLGVITFVAVLAYIAFFAIALGPIPHLMMAEIFPIHVRNTGMGMASICNWGFNFLVVFTYPLFIKGFGLAATFWIYAIACVLGFLFTRLYVPETRGVSLEDITEHLLSKKPLRELGQ